MTALLEGRKPVRGMREEPLSWYEQAHERDVQQRQVPYTGPATSGQLTALQELEYLAAGQEHAYRPVPAPPRGAHPAPAPEQAAPPGTGERAAGRHHASQSRGDEILRQHGDKFFSFSAIGGGIFIAGLVLQAALTSVLHVPSLISYVVQAVVSVEASYFLNRWFTWKGVKTPFWGSFLRYNLQKVVTVTLNLVAYGVLLKLGVEYLLDNILLTVIFTFVNYIGADKLVFLRGSKQMVAAVTGPLPVLTGPMPALRLARHPEPRRRPIWRELPSISVVIPVRSNEETIGAAVESILGQDYPMLRELVLVGSPGDSTWRGLRGIDDPRLFVMETETPPGIRDANFKRDLGIRETSGDLVSLIDSDMVIPRDWMSNAVRLLMENEVDCVAGVMRSIHDDFWGRFVDKNRLGAKTPRAASSYMVTADGFGAGGYKPPITADILFTRAMYEDVPIDGNWSHGSLEDYEWFWRVVEKGHRVLVSSRLFGWHHHRSGFKKLAGEYRRSARGCAYFIRAHRESPFAQKRMTQAVVLPLAALGVISGLAAVAALGHGMQAVTATLALGAAGVLLLCVREFIRTRTLESLVYPVPALILGINYTFSLAVHLIRNSSMYTAPTAYDLPALSENAQNKRTAWPWWRHPLALILALQAGLSLSLVWVNTAFTDEAEYLWAGHLEIAKYLHGIQLPTTLAHTLSGSPVIYPPLGAAADNLGGLAAARLLSLAFMLISTILLYSVMKQLFGGIAAIFGSVLWSISEPAIRLGAFATYDALSICLTALSIWLALRSVVSTRTGEYVALSAATLALANADAYSGVVIDPVVALFIFLAWASTIGVRRAASRTCWFVGALLVCFAGIMTVSQSWQGIMYTIFLRGTSKGFTYQANSAGFILKNVWVYSGLYLALSSVGFILALRLERGMRRWIVSISALAVLVVPVAQLHDLTEVSLDKHLAYGIWFACIACGYSCQRMIRSIPQARAGVLVLCSVLVLVYPAANAWQAAFYKQLSWSNTTAFVDSLRPIVGSTSGKIDTTAQSYVTRYYTRQGYDWGRWTEGGLPLSLSNVPGGQQVATYTRLLGREDYGVIALFYTTTVRGLPASMIFSPRQNIAREKLLNIIAGNAATSTSTQGQAALTVALEHDAQYRLAAVGPYSSSTVTGVYAIWEKVAT